MIPIPELEGKKIDRDLTPQEAMTTRSLGIKEDYDRFSNIAYPFIDVLSFQAFLAFMVYSEDGKRSCIERLSGKDQLGLGVTEKMLTDSIHNSGGALHISGHYPISEEIKQKLAAEVV